MGITLTVTETKIVTFILAFVVASFFLRLLSYSLLCADAIVRREQTYAVCRSYVSGRSGGCDRADAAVGSLHQTCHHQSTTQR